MTSCAKISIDSPPSNFVRRLKTVEGHGPFGAICQTWTREPAQFALDPAYQLPRLDTEVQA